jgi:hypothetical protein
MMNRKNFYIILAAVLTFFLNNRLTAQNTITGTVTDSLINPIPFASVYLSNTTIGTYSDIKGSYSLEIPQEGAYELIVSSIGYKHYTQTIYAKGRKQNINVKLRGNIIILNEITVRAKEKDRRKNYAQFIKTFIGETLNSQSCKITNPEDLILHRDIKNNILTGYSRKPLKIENKALGYIILYDLLDYSYNFETGFVKYSGYNHFEPLKSSPGRYDILLHRRLAAYYGSQMHFLRALFSDSLSSESFKIYDCKYDSVKKSFLLTKQLRESNLKLTDNKDFITLSHNGPLLVRYEHNHPEVFPEELSPDKSFQYSPYVLRIFSYSDPVSEPELVSPKEYNSIITISDTLKLYRNGYFYKPYSLTWAGVMARERIAEKLPSDFLPDENRPDYLKVITNNWDSLTQGLIKVESKQFAEKAYLHIDRNLYYAGDDIWFKAYVIDPSTNLLSDKTNNLHVELIAPDEKIIQSRTLRISGGLGNGDFNLSDSLPSGKYQIRAYTNHMRNYDDPFFFLKELTILNPYNNMAGPDQAGQKIVNKIDISFFPEGGSLVDNVTSKVAFKAVNALGKGCDVSVELYSSSGQLITTFNSTHLGMGYFNIKPIPGYSYYTIVKSKDRSETRVELPKSLPAGVVVHTFFTPARELILSVNTNEETLPLVKGNDLTLLFSYRNLINQIAKIRIDTVIKNLIVPADNLPCGIIRLTLSTGSGLPLCERLLFLENKNEVQLNLITDKTEYKPRELVTMDLSLTGDNSFTKTGYFSLSVAEDNFTDYSISFPTSIASWFLLESDVRGQVEEPSYYFDPSNKRRLQDLDLLLLTQGWRDFKWKYDSLASFSSETGFTISGKVKTLLGNKLLEGAKLNIGLFGTGATKFSSSYSDSLGIFKVEDIDITGRNNLFISATGRNERPVGRIFLDSVLYHPPEIVDLKQSDQPRLLNMETYSLFRQEVSYKLETRRKYKLSDTIKIGEVQVTGIKTESPETIKVQESRRVYGTPDKELIVTPAQENFAGDVFDFISGRIPGVRLIKNYDLQHQNPENIYFIINGQFGPALILLDGMRIDSTTFSSLQALQVSMIDRIDVLNASPLYGMSGANGVINIITRVGLRRPPEKLGPNAASVIINGYDAPRIFYSPKHDSDSKSAYLPDTRTTIFWEPNITIEKNLKSTLQYFNADNPNKISIVVEGITEEGIPLTGKIKYDVR